jgi:hypothetical protein
LLFAPFRHFTTDDAFIHYRFAENVAAGGGFSYNPGVPTYGDTSPLWVLLLVAAAPLAGSVPVAAKLLAGASLVLALGLFAALARRALPEPHWGAAQVTALFLLDPWLLKWGLSGMETPLAIALVLGAWLMRARESGIISTPGHLSSSGRGSSSAPSARSSPLRRPSTSGRPAAGGGS